MVPIPRKAHSPSSEQRPFITAQLIRYVSWCYNWIWLYVLVVCCTYQFVLWHWCTQGQLYVQLYIFPLITISYWTVFIRITFIFYNYWYVGVLHNRVYTVFASFPYSLFHLDVNLYVLPFSSNWKCWICLVVEGANRMRVPSFVCNVQSRVLQKMSSDLRVLDVRGLIGVINTLTDVCAGGDGALRHQSCKLVPVEMDQLSSFRSTRRTWTTSFNTYPANVENMLSS